jgi:hypothetical protein
MAPAKRETIGKVVGASMMSLLRNWFQAAACSVAVRVTRLRQDWRKSRMVEVTRSACRTLRPCRCVKKRQH